MENDDAECYSYLGDSARDIINANAASPIDTVNAVSNGNPEPLLEENELIKADANLPNQQDNCHASFPYLLMTRKSTVWKQVNLKIKMCNHHHREILRDLLVFQDQAHQTTITIQVAMNTIL